MYVINPPSIPLSAIFVQLSAWAEAGPTADRTIVNTKTNVMRTDGTRRSFFAWTSQPS
ncbi:MAG TPA: hypothetical protein VIK02_07040 [Candidatus Anoxymicrobiaceae bacterium]